MAAKANSTDECHRALTDAHELVYSVEAIISHLVSWSASARLAGAMCSATEGTLDSIDSTMRRYLDLLDPGREVAIEDLDAQDLERAVTWLYSIADAFDLAFQDNTELDAFGDACIVAVRAMCRAAAEKVDRAFVFDLFVTENREAA